MDKQLRIGIIIISGGNTLLMIIIAPDSVFMLKSRVHARMHVQSFTFGSDVCRDSILTENVLI